jgi:diketogulonate reductase-like aldo/keto reductase
VGKALKDILSNGTKRSGYAISCFIFLFAPIQRNSRPIHCYPTFSVLTLFSFYSIFVTSKVPGCGAGQGVGGGKSCGPDTKKVFTEDLSLMGVDYADLMLVHFPPTSCSAMKCKEIQEQWAVFEEMYAQKKARAIGVSNYCQSCFECLLKSAKVVPMVNQVQYHVGMGVDPIGLKTYLAAKNITMQAYSPLGDGSKDLITGRLVTSIAKAHGKASGATVALKWLVQSGVPLVTKVLPYSVCTNCVYYSIH